MEFIDFMPFVVKSPKKHPETYILVKINQKADFGCPGPLKTHKKRIGLIGVCAPGPPGPDFHHEVLKIGEMQQFLHKMLESQCFSMEIRYFSRN